jgi:hypothetical protein
MEWSIFIEFSVVRVLGAKNKVQKQIPAESQTKETSNGKSKDEIQGSFAELRMTT